MRNKQFNVILECIRGDVSCEGKEVLLLSCAPDEILHNVICIPKYVEQECKRRDSLGDHIMQNTVLKEKVKAFGLNSRKWCTSTG